MNNSNSQKPSDNSRLFANCAKDWDSCEHEKSGVIDANMLKDQENLSNQSDSSGQKNENKHNVAFKHTRQEPSSSHPFSVYSMDVPIADASIPEVLRPDAFMSDMSKANVNTFSTEQGNAYGNTTLTRLYSAFESAFTQYSPRSHAQSELEAKKLLLNPQENFNWHVCLMGYHAHNISENLDDTADSELHDPLEGAVSWLTEGMEKGWLRYVDMSSFVSPLHHSFLSQEVFWQRFVSACERKRNRFSLVLFKIADTANKDLERLELIEQILMATKKQDFFGEITGLGVALALPDSGSFGATACAERIMSRMDKILQNVSIEVGVAEAEGDENADTLFGYTKEALASKPEHGLRVQVYRNMKKDKENSSLVQSDEKRFLFFGVQ